MEIFKYTFMQHALVSTIVASIICGIIGTIIVEKKLVIFSGGLAHTTFGGIGLGYLLGYPPLVFGMIFSVVSSLLVLRLSRSGTTNKDTLIAMFWSVGMALGILFISFMPGYPPDMASYLFGNILTVSSIEITLLCCVFVITFITILPFFSYIKLYLFDETYMKTLGIRTNLFDYVLYILVALCVVTLTKVVGIILVVALLSIPTAVSKLFSKRLSIIMIIATIISFVTCLLGLYVSYVFDVSSSSTIVITLTLLYIVSNLLKKDRT